MLTSLYYRPLLIIILTSLFTLSCAHQGPSKPRPPNFSSHSHLSLKDLSKLMDYEYRLQLYENAIREQRYLDKLAIVQKKFADAQAIKTYEEEKSFRLENTYKSNQLILAEKNKQLHYYLKK